MSTRPPVLQRLTEFLSAGGLFNPGETAMANPDTTRQLILDCRDELKERHAELLRERDEAHRAIAKAWIEWDAQRDRLRAALRDLLEDTQHKHHNCADTDCPVKRAREALARERNA
jgi:hypothetical protein